MRRIDIMVDLETLGIKDGTTIFQIAAASFDWRTGAVHDIFDSVADVYSTDNLNIQGGTLKFWLDNNRDLFFSLQKRAKGTPKELIHNFHSWLLEMKEESEEVFLWGNGILFDNAKLKRAFESSGLEYPIYFRNDRDVRTLRELAEIKSLQPGMEPFKYESVGTQHDALDDVLGQINMVVAAMNYVLN